jgi:hypothetical protein
MTLLPLPLRISDRKRQVLDKLLSSDAAEKILSEAEASTLAERRELVEKIKSAPGRFAKAKAASEKRCMAAAKMVDEALAAVAAARAEQHAANGEDAAAHGDKAEIMDAEKRLLATADPRLADASRELWTLHGRVKLQWVPVPFTRRDTFGRIVHADYDGNLSECRVAWDLLKAAIDRVEVMKLAAVSRADVTKALQEIIADTYKPLESIGLKTIALDAELEIVERPYEGAQSAANPSRLAALRSELR